VSIAFRLTFVAYVWLLRVVSRLQDVSYPAIKSGTGMLILRRDITAAPTTDTLALPAETATTPLIAPDHNGPDSAESGDAPVLRSYWMRVRNLFARRRGTTGGEADEEVPLLR
jgi:hypothetical protein